MEGKRQQNWRCLSKTAPLSWSHEGKAAPLQDKCSTSNYSSSRQKYTPISRVYRTSCSQSFFLPSYASRSKEGGMRTTLKGFKTQLNCFSFIPSLGAVVKISNPPHIKQYQTGFHFPISAISPKGDPKFHILETQAGNRGLGSDLSSSRNTQGHISPGFGYHAAHPGEARTTSLTTQLASPSQTHLQKLIEQKREPICQHLLGHRLRSVGKAESKAISSGY